MIRALWSGTRNVDVEGRFYELKRSPGRPVPAHPIGIWIGAQGPRALRLTVRIADGWAAPIPSYLPYEVWPDAQHEIDKAALSAGREPREIRRIAQLVGTVTDAPGPQWTVTGAEPIRGSAEQWAAVLERLGREMGFTGFVFWPERRTSPRFDASPRKRCRALANSSMPRIPWQHQHPRHHRSSNAVLRVRVLAMAALVIHSSRLATGGAATSSGHRLYQCSNLHGTLAAEFVEHLLGGVVYDHNAHFHHAPVFACHDNQHHLPHHASDVNGHPMFRQAGSGTRQPAADPRREMGR